jgi:pyridoxal phosphate enzyme (YggS family)
LGNLASKLPNYQLLNESFPCYNLPLETLETRYHTVLQKIQDAAHKAKRNPDDITLVAVTKTWPMETILAAYAAGMRHFGENRARELAQKRPAIEAELGGDNGITWHFIGTLQSRQTHAIADFADTFHALDRLKIGNRLSKRLQENGRSHPLPVFLELNISGEMSKSGVNAAEWEEDATQQQAIRTLSETVAALPGLSLQGIMTMAPWGADPVIIRQVFRRTRLLAEWLQGELALERPLSLSMGMTDDYQLAIAEGATHVRIGRAIFGERYTKP